MSINFDLNFDPLADHDLQVIMSYPTHADITEVDKVMSNWSKNRLSEYRRMLFKDINGGQMPPLRQWPQDMVLIFYRKPMSKLEAFKLLCFLIGNSCHPNLAMYWIVSSGCYGATNVADRCSHLSDLFKDVRTKAGQLYCYNLLSTNFKHLDGSPKLWN